MLRARYYKQGENKRSRIITNNVDILAQVDQTMDRAGFVQVGLIRYIIHFITAGKRPRNANSKSTKAGDPNTKRDTGGKDTQLFR